MMLDIWVNMHLTPKTFVSRRAFPKGARFWTTWAARNRFANLFRITQTEGRLRRERIVGEDQAIQAHFGVGREIRETLKRLGATMPEDLPTAESIRHELDRQRRTRQRLKKQQNNQDQLF